MQFEVIEITNFRSIQEKVVLKERDSKLFTFVGGNSLGKSNLLRALNLFFTGEVEQGQPFDPKIDLNQANARAQARISITFVFSPKEDKRMTSYLDKKHKNEFDDYRVPLSLICFPNGNLQYSFTVSKGRKKNLPDLRERISEYVNCIYVPAIKDYKSILDSEMMKKIVSATFQGWGKGRYGSKTIGEQKEKFRKLLDEIQTVLDESGNYVSEIISNAVPAIDRFSFSLPYDNLEEFLGRLLFNFHETHLADSVNLQNVGSGIQSFTIYSMLRLLHEIRPTNTYRKSKFLWLIEEPETFMHHDLQRKTRERFREDSEVGHIFVTTHSPVFIDKGNFSSCYSVTRDTSTRVSRINSRNVRDVIGGNLGVALDDFLPFKRSNILVEGDTDSYILKKLNDLFLRSGEEGLLDFSETEFLVCGSANSIPHFYNTYNVFNHFADFLCLFDRDPAGIKAREALKNDKKVPDTNLILIPESEFRSECEIEDLIPKELWDNIIRRLDSEGLISVTTKQNEITDYDYLQKDRVEVKKKFAEYLVEMAEEDLNGFSKYKDLLKTLSKEVSKKLSPNQ